MAIDGGGEGKERAVVYFAMSFGNIAFTAKINANASTTLTHRDHILPLHHD
jgi:hypothetical protein